MQSASTASQSKIQCALSGGVHASTASLSKIQCALSGGVQRWRCFWSPWEEGLELEEVVGLVLGSLGSGTVPEPQGAGSGSWNHWGSLGTWVCGDEQTTWLCGCAWILGTDCVIQVPGTHVKGLTSQEEEAGLVLVKASSLVQGSLPKLGS